MSNDVKWVNNTLGKGAVHKFITAYLREYDNIYRSRMPAPPRRIEPGLYFINFIDTCKQILLSNPSYYHYNNSRCDRIFGPNFVYSLLLKNIVYNAKKYHKSEAAKIYELLFWFEEQGITQLLVVPLDKFAKKMFEFYSVRPAYREQEDGSLGYCSLNGTPVKTGGMEISNSRVHQLLNTIHGITQPADDDAADDDAADDNTTNVGGKKRRIHKTRRTRRRPSTKHRHTHHTRPQPHTRRRTKHRCH